MWAENDGTMVWMKLFRDPPRSLRQKLAKDHAVYLTEEYLAFQEGMLVAVFLARSCTRDLHL
jgi:hypothetical protein